MTNSKTSLNDHNLSIALLLVNGYLIQVSMLVKSYKKMICRTGCSLNTDELLKMMKIINPKSPLYSAQ